MQFKTIASLLPLSAVTFASPIPAPADVAVPFTIVKEDKVTVPVLTSTGASALSEGVYLCTETNWLGTCGYAVQPTNQCIGLDFRWWKSVSSMGPDRGTDCDLFKWYWNDNTWIYIS